VDTGVLRAARLLEGTRLRNRLCATKQFRPIQVCSASSTDAHPTRHVTKRSPSRLEFHPNEAAHIAPALEAVGWEERLVVVVFGAAATRPWRSADVTAPGCKVTTGLAGSGARRNVEVAWRRGRDWDDVVSMRRALHAGAARAPPPATTEMLRRSDQRTLMKYQL